MIENRMSRLRLVRISLQFFFVVELTLMNVEKTEGAALLICWVARSSGFLRISVRCFIL